MQHRVPRTDLGDSARVSVALRRPGGHPAQLYPSDHGLDFQHAKVAAEAIVQPAEARRVAALIH